MSAIDGIRGVAGTVSNLLRFAPEPRSRSAFGQVLNSVQAAFSYPGEDLGVNPVFVDLLQAQLQAQYEMQVVSMESNVEKSKHETQMAPIRNIRVG